MDIKESLARTPATLRSLVGQLPAGALDFHEAPDAWSPLQVLCHLADGEITDWMPRVQIILSSAPDKRFTPYDREGGFTRYRGWSAAALLDGFGRLRTENVAALSTLAIGPEQLRRQGVHPTFGPVTLEQLLATWITHDCAHLAQISRAATRASGQRVGPWTAFFSLLSPAAR